MWNSHGGICLNPSWNGEKEARAVLVANFKHRDDFKMHSQLPDYDDFQGYDLGIETILSQISQKIYSYFRKPPWKTLKHHLFMAEIPKNLFRELRNIAENDKNDDFKQERMFGGVSKIPIANTFNELVEMDFVYYGGNAAFLIARDTFPRFRAIVLRGPRKSKNRRQKWAGEW